VGGKGQVTLPAFTDLMLRPSSLLTRALSDHVVIPHWKSSCEDVEAIFESCREVKRGKNADYIPELAEADPEGWDLAIVTVDGQTRFNSFQEVHASDR